MNNVSLYGYHVTDTDNCEDILNNGFIYEHNPKHYLGQGIYFFSELNIAKLNTKNNNINYGKTTNKSIIKCHIVVPYQNFLNLDDPMHNTAFRKFWNKVFQELKENNIQLLFEEEKDFSRNKNLYYKCYMLDLYVKSHDYKVTIKTIPLDSPSYGESISTVKFSGLPYIEKYICVVDDSCIKSKEVVYSNNREDVLFI